MLATDPQMPDIDTDQWRNLQALTTTSAKARPRIIVIHEQGRVQKFRHSEGEPIKGDSVSTIDDVGKLAERVYQANADTTDFVAVFERGAVESYFAQLQDSWTADEDLDGYVYRSFTLMDEFSEGIVTYPGPARTQLGLQYRLGGSHEQVEAAIATYIRPGDLTVFGVIDDDQLWTSLVLGFDDERKISLITTVDPMEIGGDRAQLATQVVSQVTQRYRTPALALFVDRELADRLTEGFDPVMVRDAIMNGTAVLAAAPDAVAELLRARS